MRSKVLTVFVDAHLERWSITRVGASALIVFGVVLQDVVSVLEVVLLSQLVLGRIIVGLVVLLQVLVPLEIHDVRLDVERCGGTGHRDGTECQKDEALHDLGDERREVTTTLFRNFEFQKNSESDARTSVDDLRLSCDQPVRSLW